MNLDYCHCEEARFPHGKLYSADKVDEFFDWFFKSNETKKFDTLAIDSVSQLAEIISSEGFKRS